MLRSSPGRSAWRSSGDVLESKGGTSDSGERIALTRRYLTIFGPASVRLLLADREFVGRASTNFLAENESRLRDPRKEKPIVTTEAGPQPRAPTPLSSSAAASEPSALPWSSTKAAALCG